METEFVFHLLGSEFRYTLCNFSLPTPSCEHFWYVFLTSHVFFLSAIKNFAATNLFAKYHIFVGTSISNGLYIANKLSLLKVKRFDEMSLSQILENKT